MSANAEDIRVKVEKWPRLGFLEAARPKRPRAGSAILNGIDGAGMALRHDCLVGGSESALQYAAAILNTPEELLESDIGSLVIVSPGRSHINWIIASLKHGIPVLCLEPPIMNGADARRIVNASRRYNCLFAINFPYRHINGMPELREHIRQGDLGNVHTLDLTFRCGNGWIQDAVSEENKNMADLIFNLLDLALWLFDYRGVTNMEICSALKLASDSIPYGQQDIALAILSLDNGAIVKLGFSRIGTQVGMAIDMGIHGDCGGGSNNAGNDSLLSFTVEHFANSKDAQSGNSRWNPALKNWLEKLYLSPNYNAEIEGFVDVVKLIDRASGR